MEELSDLLLRRVLAAGVPRHEQEAEEEALQARERQRRQREREDREEAKRRVSIRQLMEQVPIDTYPLIRTC
jgi:hypothetical protein